MLFVNNNVESVVDFLVNNNVGQEVLANDAEPAMQSLTDENNSIPWENEPDLQKDRDSPRC